MRSATVFSGSGVLYGREVGRLISPYVRRLRLGAELRALRSERGLTHDQIAKQIGQSRAAISRLENGHGVDQAVLLQILDVLEVDEDRWMTIVEIARQAAERGWWESNRYMGARQAKYAELEAGAATIREFQMVFLPGLLQTPEFTRARVAADGLGTPDGHVADKAVEARNRRQRMLRRPDGPHYEVIIDELAVRRRAAPDDTVRAQLYHITARANSDPATTVRVLPADAKISDYGVPRTAFSIYTYPDPGDPIVVAVDTITEDLILTEDIDVKQYEGLYDRLRDAALPVAKSLTFLTRVAHRPA
jgi:transcriptional regulator with XRE-family HTH domain